MFLGALGICPWPLSSIDFRGECPLNLGSLTAGLDHDDDHDHDHHDRNMISIPNYHESVIIHGESSVISRHNAGGTFLCQPAVVRGFSLRSVPT